MATTAGGLSVADASTRAARFRVGTDNRGYRGFDFHTEGQWEGPFCFLQAADTQFGMMYSFSDDKAPPNDPNTPGRPKEPPSRWDQEVTLTTKLVQTANVMRPRPRFLVVCGDLVDAMPGVSYRQDQVRDFKAVLADLHPEIKPVCICGNHDVGDVPTPDSVEQYRNDFGDDYFSFWCGGVKFITVNSQFYHDDSQTLELSRRQQRWLDEELADSRPRKHLVGFQHIPPFVNHRDEEPVEVFGVPSLSFNFANKKRRYDYLDKLKKAGMMKLFCGHYHRNAGGFDGELGVVVTSAVGCQLGDDDHGMRVVRVLDDRIEHEYFSLDSMPTAVSLS
uniref:Calcineurin-like phosphoesterase domain-containing protein n=1 Tax=Plectus sambesii TaxID=2011161 RepID=A0A914W9M8_9BILA